MVFSYHLFAHPRYAPLTTALLEVVEAGDIQAITTTVTLAEILTRPAQLGDRKAMWDYEAYISNFPNLTIVTLDSALARETAMVRAATGMRMPDAVQVAAAVLYTADMIVTNDRAWLSKPKAAEPGAPPWPAVLLLDDHAA